MKRIATIAMVFVLLNVTAGASAASSGVPTTPPGDVRLYVLDCGTASSTDTAFLSDTGHYDGQSGKFSDPCFLVHHAKGWLLWDTGLGDALVGKPQEGPGFRFYETVSLRSQLEQLGLTPTDVGFVAVSHLHFDHVGNADQFASATWLIQRAEWAYAHSNPPPIAVDPRSLATIKDAKLTLLDADHDVFGDGTVRLLRAPGHTPGHQVLELKLAHSGVVIVGGDLYHLRQSFTSHQVPTNNASRADTLASFARIEDILKTTHGRLVIQHDPADFAKLPKFPQYLN